MKRDGDPGGTLTVGVTGHRPNRLRTDDLPALRVAVRGVLATLGRLAGGGVTVVSALAEGADRLVAEEAVAAGFRLVCPLPFSRDAYAGDFTDAASNEAFRALLREAAVVEELPGSRATTDDEQRAYAAVGTWTLDVADVLLAIWDGREARGSGGTAEIVAEAHRRGIPTMWIAARPPHRVQVLKRGDDAVGASPEALFDRLG